MIEVGLVIYPGAQQAAIFGLTDLFGVANQIAVAHQQAQMPAVRVTHWQRQPATGNACKVFDSYPKGGSGMLSALILPRPWVSRCFRMIRR